MGERLKSYLGTEVHHPRLVILLCLAAAAFVGFTFGWTMNRESHHDAGHRVSAEVPQGVEVRQ